MTEQECGVRVRQWVWRAGHVYTETPGDAWLFGRPDRHPVGAWWWRWLGELRLRPVPGRAGALFLTAELPPGP